jgi:transglutaminase-like putative cysteine protease
VGAVRVWLPVPLLASTDYFKREPDTWSGNFKSARAAGLPARDVYGVRCAASSEFKSLDKADEITGAQHCRAEVYLSSYGGVPIDPADVRKVALEENQPALLPLDDAKVVKARAKLFGAWEMN